MSGISSSTSSEEDVTRSQEAPLETSTRSSASDSSNGVEVDVEELTPSKHVQRHTAAGSSEPTKPTSVAAVDPVKIAAMSGPVMFGHTDPDIAIRLGWDILGFRSLKPREAKIKEAWMHHSSFFIFSRENRVRRWFNWLMMSTGFQAFISLCILINACIMAAFDPTQARDSARNRMVDIADNVFLAIYALEAIIKLFVLGAFLHKHSYFRSFWNWLDMVVIVTGFIEASSPALSLSAFRLLRLLRPLKAIGIFPSLRELVAALLKAVPSMLNVALMLLMFYLMCGIIGVEVIGDSLGNHCVNNATGEWEKHPIQELPFDGWTFCRINATTTDWTGGRACPHDFQCVRTREYPNFNATRFDNFGVAVVSLFQTVSMENWIFISYWAMDSVNDFVVIFFIIVRLFGFFMVLGLFLASVRGAWRRQKELRKHLRRAEKDKKTDVSAMLESTGLAPESGPPGWFVKFTTWLARPAEQDVVEAPGYLATFYRLGYSIQHKLLENKIFNGGVILVVVLNAIVLCMDAYGAPKLYLKALDGLNLAFTMIFTLEAVARLLGLGLLKYFSSILNWLDLIVIISGWAEAISSDTVTITALRVIRVLRLFKALRAWPRLRKLLDALGKVGSLMFWTLALLMLIIFVYALVGMHLFGGKFHFEGLEHQPRFHFDNLYWAIVSVFMILGVLDWNEILFSGIRAIGYPSMIYFFTLLVLSTYLVVNLFVSVIITAITEAAKEDHEALHAKYKKAHHHEEKEEEMAEIKPEAGLAEIDMEEAPKNRGHVEDMDDDWKRSLKYPSLLCLSGTNKFRLALGKFINWTPVSVFLSLIVIASCVTLAMEVSGEPAKISVFGPEPNFRDTALFWIDCAFLVIFGLEVLIGIIVHGFAFHPYAYLRNPWNWVDLITFIGMLVDYATVHYAELAYLRALRSLRAIKIIAKFRFTRVVLHTLGKALPFLPAIVPVCIFVWFMFSILGLQLFNGIMWRCNDLEVLNHEECVGNFTKHLENGTVVEAERQWYNQDNNWDNIGESFFNVFKMGSFEGTLDTLLHTVDAAGVGKNPVRDSNPPAALYYIFFIPFATWIVLGLTVGTIVDTFAEIRREEGEDAQVGMTEDQRQWVEMQKLLISTLPGIKAPPPKATWRVKLYNFVKNKWFEAGISAVILINIIILCINAVDQSAELQLLQTVADYLFTIIYMIEAATKIIAIGPKWYFRDGWNILDIIIVVASILGWIISGVTASTSVLGGVVKAIRVLRVLRVVKLFKGAKDLRLLIKTIVLSLPAMLNVFLVCFLVMYAFAIVGVVLFKEVEEGFAISDRANFKTFGQAIFLLLRMATGERWDLIMYDIAKATSKWAYAYFILYVVVVTHVLVNSAVAIVIDSFSFATNTLAERDVTLGHFTNFFQIWNDYDKEGRGTIPVGSLSPFLRQLPPPLGVGSNATDQYMNLFFSQTLSQVPITNNSVFFPHVLLNLTRRAMSIESIPQAQYDKMLAKWQKFYRGDDNEAGDLIKLTIDDIVRVIAAQRVIRSFLLRKRLRNLMMKSQANPEADAKKNEHKTRRKKEKLRN